MRPKWENAHENAQNAPETPGLASWQRCCTHLRALPLLRVPVLASAPTTHTFAPHGSSELWVSPKSFVLRLNRTTTTPPLLRRKLGRLCSLPRDAQEAAWMFLKQPLTWPCRICSKRADRGAVSPHCAFSGPPRSPPPATVLLTGPALLSEKALFPAISKHGL